jgi:DNA-binding MarR family transcriptional regulator
LLLASRAVSRLYNDEIRKTGIEITQFGMLELLNHLGPMTQNQLGERMAAGKTTVSRNVKLLERQGWVSIEEGGDDRRRRVVSLTEGGRKQLKKTRPHWQRAQERIEAAIPAEQLKALRDLLPMATEAVLSA